MRPEDVWGELDQLGGQGGQPVDLARGIAVRKAEVLPLHIAQVVQALPEGRKAPPEVRRGVWFQHADQWDVSPRLPFSGGEHSKETAGESEEHPEDSTLHSALPQAIRSREDASVERVAGHVNQAGKETLCGLRWEVRQQ